MIKASLSNLPSISPSIPCCPLTALQERNSWADHEPKESFFSSNNASIYANRFYCVGSGSRISAEKTARSQKERPPWKSRVIIEHLMCVDPSYLSWQPMNQRLKMLNSQTEAVLSHILGPAAPLESVWTLNVWPRYELSVLNVQVFI